MTTMDPYLRIVEFFDKDETAGSFLRENGEGGFVSGIYRMAREIDRLRALPATSPEVDLCPVCAEPFKSGDICATDIELGACHAACLEGSPVVNLDTGEPANGPIATYPYEEDPTAPSLGAEAQITHMVGRFLNWKLPENFNPDGGISFKAEFNEHTAHPMKHEPSGTNLLDASQADAMVRHMLDGRPIAPATDGWLTNAAADVLAERRRHVEAEGWTPEHDNCHSNGQIAAAAACYALGSDGVNYVERLGMHGHVHQRRTVWPWGPEWWKPTNRRRDLVKAGSLILAEIERLDRLPTAPTGERS